MTEFGLIDYIRTLCTPLPANGFDGIGDDCAVLPLGDGESLVFTTDMLCEGVHFLREAVSPAQLGRKSLAVNLSDVAAMGATPVASLLAFSLPPDAMGAWAEAFMEGYCDLSAKFHTALAGGDTTASKAGITISVTAIGRVKDTSLKRRSAARPGDVVLTNGRLGASGAGLRDILAGHYDTPLARVHHNPEPQVAEGVWLGAQPGVHAMMDISDGLASDIRHILSQSGVGARIDLDRIPAVADIETALGGGEDYKLLFTAGSTAAGPLMEEYAARFGAPLYPVGQITAAPGLVWVRDGHPVDTDYRGFRHY